MPFSLDEIVEQTRLMPPDAVAELVDRIMLTRHGGVESTVQKAWDKELKRRVEDFRSGNEIGVPLEESLAKARKIAGL